MNAVAEQNKTEAVSTTVEPKPLFETAIFANSPKLEKAFGLKPIKNKEGGIIGGSLGLLGRRDAAAAFDLKGKDNAEALTEAMRQEAVSAFKQLRSWLIAKGDDTTGLVRMAQRKVGKEGVNQTTMVIRDMPQRERAMLEKYAASLGIEPADLAEFLEKTRKKTVTVEATVTTTAAPPVKR